MKKLIACCVLIATALVLAGCPPTTTPEVVKSSEKALLSFRFEQSKNAAVLTQDYNGSWNALQQKWTVGPLPAGTNVTALVATFTVSASATVAISGTAQTSGVTANNFSTAKVYTVTAEDGSTATYTVEVTVTPPSSSKDITAYSLSDGTNNFVGVIDEGALPNPTITVSIPTAISRDGLIATFTLSDATAAATVSATPQVSGTTPNNFGSAVDYVVTAEDLTTKTYSVSVAAPVPAAAEIIEICPSYTSIYAQGSKEYVDIRITNVTSLGTGWKVYAGNDAFVNPLVDTTGVVQIPAAIQSAIADGDIIRLHAKSYTPVDTTAKTDDGTNTTVWDVATDYNFFTNYKHCVLWIEKADGTVVDIVTYKSNANTGAWVSNATVTAKLQAAVTAGIWGGTTIDYAVNAGETMARVMRLKSIYYDGGLDGNKSADWEQYAPYAAIASSNPVVTPSWTNTSTGDHDVLLSLDVYYGGDTISSVTADLSAAGLSNSVALYDDGTHGDVTANDYKFSATYTIPQNSNAGVWTALFDALLTGGSFPTQKSVSFRIATTEPPNYVFDNSDFEINPATSTLHAIATYVSTTGHDGNPTRAMHVVGSPGSSNTTLFLTSANCNAKGAFTKVTFWIKADAAIGKQLNFVFGNQTSNVPAGQLFQLNSTNYLTSVTPNAATANLSYATTNQIPICGWTKVTFTLDSASPTDTALQFMIRIGSSTTYDFWIDDILFE